MFSLCALCLCGEICTESRKMEIAKMRLLRESILKFTRSDKLTKDINERNDPNGIVSYLIIEMPKSCTPDGVNKPKKI